MKMYSNGEFAEVIAMLGAATDPEERTGPYGEAQWIRADDEASIFVIQLAKTDVRNASLMGM